MKIVYHLAEIRKGFYAVTASTVCIGLKDNMYYLACGTHCEKALRMEDVHKSAIKSMRARMYSDHNKNSLIPTSTGCLFVWDEDRSDLITFSYKKPEPAKDCVYEVDKVNDVWTIIKHDSPLFTFEEATQKLYELLTKGDANA